MAFRWVFIALLLLLAECRSEQVTFSTQAAIPVASSQPASRAAILLEDTVRSSTPQDAGLFAIASERITAQPSQKRQRHLIKLKPPLLRTLAKIKEAKQLRSLPTSRGNDKDARAQALLYLLLTLFLFLGGVFLVFLATKALILASPSFPGIVLGTLVALLGLVVVLLLIGLFIFAFWPGKPIVL